MSGKEIEKTTKNLTVKTTVKTTEKKLGKINLLDLSVDELQTLLTNLGQQKFRAKQIFSWLSRGAERFDEMTDLSKSLRELLSNISFIGSMKIIDKQISKIDQTAKYLFELNDNNIIESVMMEYIHGYTACISTQVGCRMGCTFCASTGIGFIRNLTPGEMLGQILKMQTDTGKRIGNVVLMGIGEPLDNYDNVIKFMKLLNSPDGLNVGYRHVSLSTCGIVPKMLELANEKLPITLSISLHAPNDEIRNMTMPVNKLYSIDKIIEGCKIYTEVTKRRITFEYALISEINDSISNAEELAKKIKGMLAHVNLIPVNTVKTSSFKKSSRKQILDFKNLLESYGIETTIRRELGTDIEAACGQLRRSEVENKNKMDTCNKKPGVQI
ncbi:MAG: 23S rRNA (adenine(2503)-C(2))-methyltransferase RlmN [Clostridia bacterium]|jgi:23S rRNA (adenine2503-C2)-methyltransferase